MTARQLNATAVLNNAVTEAQLQAKGDEVARLLGWTLQYHTHDSRRSDPGFPDRVYVRPPRLLFVEYKRERGRVRPDQTVWALALVACSGVEYLMIHPSTFNLLEEALRMRRRDSPSADRAPLADDCVRCGGRYSAARAHNLHCCPEEVSARLPDLPRVRRDHGEAEMGVLS